MYPSLDINHGFQFHVQNQAGALRWQVKCQDKWHCHWAGHCSGSDSVYCELCTSSRPSPRYCYTLSDWSVINEF